MPNHSDQKLDIPFSLAEVDADYLTGALRRGGLLRDGSVESFDSEITGEGAGFLGEIASLRLTVRGSETEVPESLILKLPTALKNREMGQTLGAYEREIRFYRELQPLLQIRTPAHYFSDMDVTTDPRQSLKAIEIMASLPLWLIRLVLPLANRISAKKSSRYILMIEDLGHHRVGDQVAGCPIEDARTALRTMAMMHAQFWNYDRFDDFPWLIPVEIVTRPLQTMYLQALGQFKESRSNVLTSSQINLLDFLKANYFQLVARFDHRPRTLMHGDFRLDNLCFDDKSGEVVLFDWQTLGIGTMGMDVAYFVSGSLHSETDDEIDDLLEYYRNELAAGGVTVSREELLWEYECGLAFVLHRMVPALFQDMIQLEGRGGDLIDTWIQRIFQKLGRIDPERLLAGPPAPSAV